MSCKTAAQARGEAKMSSVPCPLDADRPEAKRIKIRAMLVQVVVVVVEVVTIVVFTRSRKQ